MRSKRPIALPNVPFGDRIPRILHQTYPTARLPDALRRNVEELERQNPGWDYRFYDDDAIVRFIGDDYGRPVLDAYRRISPDYGVARADLFRYLALYRCGGIYLDVKSRFQRPIDDLVRGDEGYILSRWRNRPGEVHDGWGLHADLDRSTGGELQQWHVITAAGHPFLRAVIERVLHGIDHYSARRTGTGWIGVLRLTGPIAYTQAIIPLLDQYPCRIVSNEQDIGLEYSALPASTHQALFKRHYTQSTKAVVDNVGLAGLADSFFLKARTLKHWFEGLCQS